MSGRQQGADPERLDFERTTDRLLEWAILGSASLLAGALIGVALRRTSLRWSVALVGLPLSAAPYAVEPRAGVSAALATLAATAVGSYHSHLERQKGGDDNRGEQSRVGLIRAGWQRLSIRRARAHRIREGEFALGAAAGRVAWVRLGDARGGIHTFIPGKSGSGKTVTAAALLQAYVHSGAAAVVVDPKGDRELERWLRASASQAGAPMAVVEPGVGELGYNVAARGDDSAVAEKLLSTHEWSEPHYRAVAQRYAQATVSVLRLCGEALSLRKIGHYMHPDRLEALAVSNQTALAQVDALRADLPKRTADELAGARSRIAQLTESDHGRWLDPDERSCVDFEALIRRRGVLYFRLDAAEHPELTKLLAASIVLDLVGISKGMQGSEHKAVLFFDEFAELGADKVSRLLATGRAAGLSVLLAAQAMADLQAARGDATLAAQVIGNCEYCIVHHTPDPDAAQLFAGLTGTYATWLQTEAYPAAPLTAPDARSKLPTREYNVHPDVFKNLGTGEAVVISRRDPGASERVQVWPPDGSDVR